MKVLVQSFLATEIEAIKVSNAYINHGKVQVHQLAEEILISFFGF